MRLLSFTKLLIILFVSSTAFGCEKNENTEELVDKTPPAGIANLKAIAEDGAVTLQWTNPTDADFDYVLIQYNNLQLKTDKSSASIPDLTNGVSYTFRLSAFDTNGNESGASSISAKPVEEDKTVYPTDIIPGLTKWKVTLPVDKDGNDSSQAADVNSRNKDPWEIADDDLVDFQYSPYFEVRDGEVVFRGHCAGATTSGSKYPRCELRQRVGGGNNYWSVHDFQYLQTELRVTHLPVEKPEVCMVQIHGPEDEPLRLQFHKDKGLNLVWNEDNKNYFKSDVPYSLGQRLQVTVTVNKGDIMCIVKNLDTSKQYSYSWTSEDQTGYFKVGCYTQSSIFLNEFKSDYSNEPIDAYGEVVVSKITLQETYKK